MKTEKDVRHQLTAEAKQLSSITDEDSDIEIMIPAPDETEGHFFCLFMTVTFFVCLVLALIAHSKYWDTYVIQTDSV